MQCYILVAICYDGQVLEELEIIGNYIAEITQVSPLVYNV